MENQIEKKLEHEMETRCLVSGEQMGASHGKILDLMSDAEDIRDIKQLEHTNPSEKWSD